ncbi:hypothetical protein MHBO_001105, partial [Bonamia ostreae]
KESIKFLKDSWLPARRIVLKAISERFEFDKSGKIIVLDKFCPWRGIVDEENKDILYVVYKQNAWRIMAVSEYSFKSKKPLKSEWRGLTNEKLEKVSGIKGAIFVHATGFTGGSKTIEGVLEMAKKSMID